jgi:hypothetical protein
VRSDRRGKNEHHEHDLKLTRDGHLRSAEMFGTTEFSPPPGYCSLGLLFALAPTASTRRPASRDPAS